MSLIETVHVTCPKCKLASEHHEQNCPRCGTPLEGLWKQFDDATKAKEAAAKVALKGKK